MATNVKVRYDLSARVNVENATSGPKEGKQWFFKLKGTSTCSLSEWNWRKSAISTILSAGSTTYTSYGNAIGHGWV